VITGNTCNSNKTGIWLSASPNNLISGNIVNSNAYEGIFINNEVTGNVLYLNNFSNNDPGSKNVHCQGITSFTVPAGKYLAAIVTNYTGISHDLLLGFGVSFTSPPGISCAHPEGYSIDNSDLLKPKNIQE
jgi:parallel beta-helix repeat protein